MVTGYLEMVPGYPGVALGYLIGVPGYLSCPLLPEVVLGSLGLITEFLVGGPEYLIRVLGYLSLSLVT